MVVNKKQPDTKEISLSNSPINVYDEDCINT